MPPFADRRGIVLQLFDSSVRSSSLAHSTQVIVDWESVPTRSAEVPNLLGFGSAAFRRHRGELGTPDHGLVARVAT